MNKSVGIISAFLGGALVGASIALLFAPEKGVDTRARIKALLKSKGIDFSDDEVEQVDKVMRNIADSEYEPDAMLFGEAQKLLTEKGFDSERIESCKQPRLK